MAYKAGSIYGEAVLDTKKWDSGLKSMAGGVAKFTAGAAAAFAAVMVKNIANANEYQKSLSNVSTVVDTTAVSMQGLSKSLLQMDPILGDTTDLTNGLYQAFSAGAEDAKEAMQITSDAAKFSAAALTDTATAVDVLTTATNAYGKDVYDTTQASDIFFTTIKQGKITGEELSATIGQSIPLYASMGIELEQLSSGMAAMTKQGISSAEATTQLNAIVNSFIKPSSDLTAILGDMGYASGAAFIEAEGLTGALDLLQETTGGNADELGRLVPNIRGMKGAMALTGQGGKIYTDILEEMESATGAADEAFGKQERTMVTLQSAMDKVSIVAGNIGKTFTDKIAASATEAATSMLDFLMSSRGMEVVAQIAEYAAGGFELIRSSASFLVDTVLPPLNELWGTVVESLAEITGESEGSAGGMRLLAGALKLSSAGLVILSKIAETSIIAIKDVALVTIETAKAVGSFFSVLSRETTWSDVKDSFSQVGSAIENLGSNFIENGRDVVATTMEQFSTFGQDVEEIQMSITTSVQASSQKAREFVTSNWDEMIYGIEGSNSDLLNSVTTTNDGIVSDTDDAAGDVAKTWEEAYKDSISSASKYSDIAMGTLGALFSGITGIKNKSLEDEAAAQEESFAREKEAFDEQLANRLITQAAYDQGMADLENKQSAKMNEISKKQFENEKTSGIAGVWIDAASAIAGFWAASASLGPIAGPIFGGLMSATMLGMGIKQSSQIKNQKYVPQYARGGTTSGGLITTDERGPEMKVLPDGTKILPSALSREIARDAGRSETNISVSFAGANISDNMSLDRIVEQVSRKLGRELRKAS